MARIVLEKGKWFEEDQAERYEEKLIFEPDEEGKEIHKCLFRTKKGNWVRNIWETVGGEVSGETYEEIDMEEAADWFYNEGYESDEIPEDVFHPENEI